MFLFVTHLFNAKYLFKCIKVEWKNENVFFSKQRMCRPFMAFCLITYEKRGLSSPLSMPICMGILISPFYYYLNH